MDAQAEPSLVVNFANNEENPSFIAEDGDDLQKLADENEHCPGAQEPRSCCRNPHMDPTCQETRFRTLDRAAELVNVIPITG